MTDADPQYPSNRRHFLPFKAVYLQCLDENGAAIENAYASGFVVREADGLYLYTCWHVVTGYDKHLVRVGHQLPSRMSIRIKLQASESIGQGMETIGGAQEITLPLYDRSGGKFAPLWFQDEQDVPQGDLNAIGIRVPFWHDAVKLRLPETIRISDLQVIDQGNCLEHLVDPGDKVYLVGYPYGYSALGEGQPTPIVLTRFIAALRVADRQREIVLDGYGAPGMSGGPVFVDTARGLRLLGPYTGLIYPDHVIEQNEKITALGTCCDMTLCWQHSTAMGLRPVKPPETFE